MSIGPMQLANGLVSLLAAAMLAGLILNPRINEGVVDPARERPAGDHPGRLFHMRTP